MIPKAGPILTQGPLFKQKWLTPIRRCFRQTILALAVLGFLKEDFLSFYYIHKGKNNDTLGWGQF
jgi:hypothetical protein